MRRSRPTGGTPSTDAGSVAFRTGVCMRRTCSCTCVPDRPACAADSSALSPTAQACSRTYRRRNGPLCKAGLMAEATRGIGGGGSRWCYQRACPPPTRRKTSSRASCWKVLCKMQGNVVKSERRERRWQQADGYLMQGAVVRAGAGRLVCMARKDFSPRDVAPRTGRPRTPDERAC